MFDAKVQLFRRSRNRRPDESETTKFGIVSTQPHQEGGGLHNEMQSRVRLNKFTTDPWIKILKTLHVTDKSAVMLASHIPAVVVKIGHAETVNRELRNAILIRKHKVPGFVKLKGAFLCDDDMKKYRNDMTSIGLPLCNGKPGAGTRVLVMPYFGPSVFQTNWEGKFDILIKLLRSAAMALCIAYDRLGLSYTDTHLDNLMIVSHDAESDIRSSIMGYPVVFVSADALFSPVWIDLENAMIDANRQSVSDTYNAISNMLTDTKKLRGVKFTASMRETINMVSALADDKAPFNIQVVRAIGDAIGSIKEAL